MPRDGGQGEAGGGAAVLSVGDPRLEPIQLLDVRALAAALYLSVATVRRKVKLGELPQPAVRMGQRIVRWRLRDVRAFLDGQTVRNVT